MEHLHTGKEQIDITAKLTLNKINCFRDHKLILSIYRDYTNSRNQRYTTPELAARNRIVKPTHVLHWYNAPVTMTEEKLKDVYF